MTDPRAALAAVTDPEIPVLTIEDLGILREVIEHPDGTVEVVITPTYSGCPAMAQIEADVRAALEGAGHESVRVTTVLSPAWTTDWMSEDGRRKLREFGIAPPAAGAPRGPVSVTLSACPPAPTVLCPQCGGVARESSRFGSTACKAAYICTQCAEPFDYFKAI
ncbi:1,2-phenylacetyl-CoA epoxidase subunit PaaD [Janibacter sp. GXQ6167]|uniref:1,2-phenylacetyl-CoA epoxidase subunit PaaD n=1 Tax=Janibacter sp. GXQ6167 TaxID=3240791 RepID=UPI003525C309